MGIHGIIRDTPVLFYKVQVRFACLEEDLYVPAFPINADDFFFGKPCIRAYDYLVLCQEKVQVKSELFL